MKLPKFLAGIIGGTTLGLLFAQKKGKDFRKTLLADKDKLLEVLGKEFLSVGKEIADEVKKLSATEDAQKLIEAAKTKFKGITEIAKKEGGTFAQDVEKYLSEIGKYAKEKAEEIQKEFKPKMQKKATSVKKNVQKKVAQTKKAVVKKATVAKKNIVKKTVAVKKEAAKKVQKAGKTVKGILM